ncbi:MAG: DUF1553 domain-containing protein [Bacteroidota bacterium]
MENPERSYFLLLFLIAAMVWGCQAPNSLEESAFSLPQTVDFNFHIKPILSDRCFTCHGPDEDAREGDLRLDTEEGAFAALDSAGESFAIVPGDQKKSLLLHKITHLDPEERMPPPASNLTLSEREIALLKKWINQGAEWKAHWSFIPPQKPELPDSENNIWSQNEIDHFILARMEEEGLEPSDEATKTELIRRLAFDLTGLPPSLEEVETYLADQSEGAFERMIDHYLSSPAYGERMATPWLDLARYADTHGYQDDLDRTVWPWRDWVIKAFNENMPFDQFTQWQLAGDLLPNPTYEQTLATAFNRNHPMTQEQGSIEEEYLVEYAADRTQTIATTFLGLTLQCARCHDHKYDPISQKEYYELFAFNNQVPEKGILGYLAPGEPTLPLPEETVEEVIAYLRKGIDQAKEQLQTVKEKKSLTADQDSFESWQQDFPSPISTADTSSTAPTPLPPDLVAYYNFDHFDDGMVHNLVEPEKSAPVGDDVIETRGKFGGAVEFFGDNFKDRWQNHLNLGDVGDLDLNKPFTFSAWVYLSWSDLQANLLSKMDLERKRGYQMTMFFVWPMFKTIGPGAIEIMGINPYPISRWAHMAWTYDGSRKATGFTLYIDGKSQVLRRTIPGEGPILERTIPNYPVSNDSPLLLGREKQESWHYQRVPIKVDELHYYKRELREEEVQDLAHRYNPIASIQNKDQKSPEEQKSLHQHYLHSFDEEYQAAIQHLEYQKIIEQQVRKQLQPVMVMGEKKEARSTHVLDRGLYDSPREQVFPATPQAVLPFPDKLPGNRLGLAQWITDPDNPLTARVIVNRFWQMIFGKGIVATPDDFGSQGALPTHPELLDWLAVEFMESNWDVKYLLKLMVSSATYRQSSKVSPNHLAKDPENLFLSRAAQHRLPAEMIRDNFLHTSGLLIPKIGGPSVRPYQPAGLWEELSCGRGTKYYFQDSGEALYRRSLYTFWKRTVAPPNMSIFDAASRQFCEPKRQSTSTPFQALALLNDPQVLEAARALGLRMMKEGGRDNTAIIRYGFRLATSRWPSNKELDVLIELWESEKAIYEDKELAARELLSIGSFQAKRKRNLAEWAAYAQVASALFNMDEVMVRY